MLKMKNIFTYIILMALSFSSCSIDGGEYEKLPLFEENDITHFRFEFRYETINANNIAYVEIIDLNTTGVVIDPTAHTVTIAQIVVPEPSGTFTPAIKTSVTINNVIGVATISTGAILTVTDGGGDLGTPSSFSAPRTFRVTAADGKHQEWTVIVQDFING